MTSGATHALHHSPASLPHCPCICTRSHPHDGEAAQVQPRPQPLQRLHQPLQQRQLRRSAARRGRLCESGGQAAAQAQRGAEHSHLLLRRGGGSGMLVHCFHSRRQELPQRNKAVGLCCRRIVLGGAAEVGRQAERCQQSAKGLAG